jgi:hypothetical protein
MKESVDKSYVLCSDKIGTGSSASANGFWLKKQSESKYQLLIEKVGSKLL